MESMVLKMRKMKDSGIEWIGEIPEGWTKNKVIRLFDTIGSGTTPKNITSDFPVVNWIQSGDITGSFVPACKNVISANLLSQYSALKVYPAPFIIIAMYGASVGNASISLIDGCVNQACCVLSSPSCNLHYAFYVIKSAQSYLVRKAVGGGQPNISQETIKQLWLPLPPLSTQDIIVRNLDATCSKIDDLLTSVHASIEEYKKLKQAVITQAVTKGVRGEREMKDSGVEWIGEIPKEWRKTQLRHCATIKSGITLGKSYSKDTILIERPYLRVANVQGGYVDLNDLATIEVTPDEDLKYRLHSGDVLMTEGGDRDKLGRGCVWHGEIEPCLHQNHVFAVQTNEAVLLPEFLEYLTASDVGRSYFDVTAIKTTNLACTSSSKVLAFTIPLPPIEEQIEIVGFIKKRSLELNKLIMKKELLVQELESYKKSLIYEVVTGKREV